MDNKKVILLNLQKVSFSNKETGQVTTMCKITYGIDLTKSDSFNGYSILETYAKESAFNELEKVLKKEDKADFDSQYIGKIVKCTETITKTTGAVSIYDERWDARLLPETEEEISVGSDVKIIKNNSTILYVEKV